MKHKVISRAIAYHGTTQGALSITGLAAYRTPFEPLVPGAFHVASTNRYRCRFCSSAPDAISSPQALNLSSATTHTSIGMKA